MSSSRKKFKGQDNSKKGYEAIEDDPSLPPGWKSSWRINNGLCEGTKSKVFWAPNGKFMSSRIAALHYMVSGEISVTQEGLAMMRGAIMEEGWEVHPSVPEGWLCKDDLKSFKKFLPQDNVFLKNTKLPSPIYPYIALTYSWVTSWTLSVSGMTT